MRLVCPNCVAQYEVADGTIPESGRDVQCANCNHIWFQDAAFKLSTDDLTHVPQRLHATYDPEDDEDDAGDAKGVFHSKRAPKPSADPDEVTERALPEVGNNVLDILRSEAAFSSRRRAGERAEPSPPQQPGPDEAKAGQGDTPPRQVGTRAGDVPPLPEPDEPEQEHAPVQRADDFAPAEPAPESRLRTWRHVSPVAAEPEMPAEPEADDDEDDLDDTLTGLPADEAKRIADAAVGRSMPPPAQREPDDLHASPPEQEEDFRQTLHRVSVRSLAEAPAEDGLAGPGEDAAEVDASEAEMPEPQEERSEDLYEAPGEDAFTTSRALPEEDATEEAPFEPDREEPGSDLSLEAAESELSEDAEAATRTGDEPDEPEYAEDTGDTEDKERTDNLQTEEDAPQPAAAALSAIEDPNDIRQVRRSLVENRKVLLPDVDELNTSLRMEESKAQVDLRSSAFSDEDIANRNKFWLGLVTALMLFGILSALYLMGPAIADVFPEADPYVAAYRDFVHRSLDATAAAWIPVVEWLETFQ